jgi:hypothetical protein
MAQAVSRWLLTTEARVRARLSPHGICGGQNSTGAVFLPVRRVSMSISFRYASLCSYMMRRMNNTPVSGRSSETQSHPHRHEHDPVNKPQVK